MDENLFDIINQNERQIQQRMSKSDILQSISIGLMANRLNEGKNTSWILKASRNQRECPIFDATYLRCLHPFLFSYRQCHSEFVCMLRAVCTLRQYGLW